MKPRLLPLTILLCLATLTVLPASAQTGATASVVGTVTDATGAVVPGANVELSNPATGNTFIATTNAVGQFTFASVPPATYKLTVTMTGFQTKVITDLKLQVSTSRTVPVELEVGELAEVIEVTSEARVELQTTDATVGTVLGGEELQRLPTTNRSAASILLLQPMVMPGRGLGHSFGGQVSGARADQSTFMLDGGDATSDTEGTGAYNSGSGEPGPMIPVPVDSIEEFRVSSTNPNADFSRSPGGQISFITKRGTNNVHGSVYWYHQNDNLNANTWDLNRTGVKKPELKDNRFGASAGGALMKDKLFLFGHYEGRRFPRSGTITRLVPTNSLRNGILTFVDGSGTEVAYDLASSTACGDGTVVCDPRILGISPVTQALWAMLPQGNDTSLGDGRNTIGFRDTADSSLESDFAVGRLDYNINDNWNYFASYRYYTLTEPDTSQVDIAGLISGQPGKAVSTANSPIEPRYVVTGVTGQINPNLTNDVRFSWFRHWWEWARAPIGPQVPGTTAAVQLAGEPGLVSEPFNIDTQNARSRIWNGKDTFVGDNATWIKGSHTIQFGGGYRRHDIFHQRDDKVTAGLTSPIYWLDADEGVNLTDATRPVICSSTITTNCLLSAETGDWDSLYAATLGLVDKAAVVAVARKDLSVLPLGTPLRTNVDVHAFDMYAQDIWRMSPSFTLTYGLSYMLQMPPIEEDDLQTILVFADTEELFIFDDYIRDREAAALQGQIFNPEFAWSTIERTGRKHIYDPDYNNFGPRVAAAWNPSMDNWFFGDRKTVLRGGYSLSFDRLTGVNLVMGAPITVGFGRTFQCIGPSITGTCTGADPTNAFRIGVDGDTVDLSITDMSDPVQVGIPFGANIATQYDINFEMGEHHRFDFTIQRELPGNMILEVGYASRLGRNLQARTDLNSVPLMFTDQATGQTLAEAFDAVAAELRGGVSASSVTAQPLFENLLGGATTCAADPDCSGKGSWTALLASKRRTNFIRGELSDAMTFGLDRDIFNNIFGATAMNSLQVSRNRVIIDGHRSNYHAGFVTLRKRFSEGLTFNVNYTWSKSLDQLGRNQQSSNTNSSAFNRDFHYGPSLWDRTHALNAHWFYELPMGAGRAIAPESNVLEKIVGGWYVSGIHTANSGLPLCVSHENGIFGGGRFSENTCALRTSSASFNTGVHRGVTPSGGSANVNLFADPDAVLASLRRVNLATDGRSGRGAVRGLPRWNLDLSLGKKTIVTEDVNVVFTVDFLNIVNHMEFNDPSITGGSSLRLRSPSNFGRLTSQFGGILRGPRRIQFGLRLEF